VTNQFGGIRIHDLSSPPVVCMTTAHSVTSTVGAEGFPDRITCATNCGGKLNPLELSHGSDLSTGVPQVAGTPTFQQRNLMESVT